MMCDQVNADMAVQTAHCQGTRPSERGVELTVDGHGKLMRSAEPELARAELGALAPRYYAPSPVCVAPPVVYAR